MAAVAPCFKAGDRVRVRAAHPPGHVRTPWFCRGKTGQVAELAGNYENPEELAYGRSGEPALPLYRVRFLQRDLWPDYAGGPKDTTVIDLYQHWLEPAGE
ncbi:MAG: SH3-like domain-containing protein [Alphaproteobacteria bacterium]